MPYIRIIEKTINIIFWGLILFLPLIFFRFTLNYSGLDAITKSYLLWIFAPILLFFLIYKALGEGGFAMKSSAMDYPIFTLVVVLLLSGIFGLDAELFLWGNPQVMILPYLSLLSLVSFYYFAINFLKNESDIKKVFKFLLISFGAAVVFVLVAFVFKWLGFVFGASALFKIISLALGSFEDLSMYLAPMTILALAFSFDRQVNLFPNNYLKIIVVLGFFLLIIINYIPAWWIFLLGSVFLYIKERGNSPEIKKSFYGRILLILSISSLLILILNHTITGQLSAFSQRQSSNFQADLSSSLFVSRGSLAHDFFLGQGSESFPFIFSKYRNSSLNNTSWWDIRFGKSFSLATDFLATGGVIVFLSYVFFIISILFLAFRMNKILDKEDATGRILPRYTILLIIMLIFEQIIYSFNITLLFIFFLALAVQMFYTEKFSISLFKNRLNFSISREAIIPRQRLIYFIGGIVFLLFVFLIAKETKVWLAEIFYQKAVFAQDVNEREKALISANSFNKQNSRYEIALAKLFKNKALAELQKGTGEKDLKVSENFVNNAINLAKSAVSNAPYSALSYEALGLIYRDLAAYSVDSIPLSVSAFKMASELEPANPVILTELGKMSLQNNKPLEAETSLRKAKELKNDYLEANLYLSRALANQGKYQEALEVLGELEALAGIAEVKIEIGRVYFNMNNYTAAQAKFSEAVAISPVNANALFSLGLSLEKQGKVPEAVLQYRKALNLNPNHNELRRKIGELEK